MCLSRVSPLICKAIYISIYSSFEEFVFRRPPSAESYHCAESFYTHQLFTARIWAQAEYHTLTFLHGVYIWRDSTKPYKASPKNPRKPCPTQSSKNPSVAKYNGCIDASQTQAFVSLVVLVASTHIPCFVQARNLQGLWAKICRQPKWTGLKTV